MTNTETLKIFELIKNLYNPLRKASDHEELEACKEYLLRRDLKAAEMFRFVSIAYLPLAAILGYVLGRGVLGRSFSLGNLALLLVTISWPYVFKTKNALKWMAFVVLTISGAMHSTIWALEVNAPFDWYLYAYPPLTFATYLLLPTSTNKSLIAGIFWMTIAVISCHFTKTTEVPAGWWLVEGLVLSFGFVMLKANVLNTVDNAMLEYSLKEARAETVRAREDRDLELAKGIQDSLLPEGVERPSEKFKVSFFHKKYKKIGGDWYNFRTQPDGSLVIIVVDATGKGVQAALVIHAIQALWAMDMENKKFDPDSWLVRVNRTLFTMGRGSQQSATIGIAVTDGKKVEYWSVGHPPLIVAIPGSDGPDVHQMLTPVSPIGVIENINILSSKFDVPQNSLSEDQPFRMVLFSDGVFERSMPSHQKMVSLLKRLDDEDENLLEIDEVEDDKTLISVEYKC